MTMSDITPEIDDAIRMKVLKREATSKYQQRCIEANICPDCGTDLINEDWEEHAWSITCPKCIIGHTKELRFLGILIRASKPIYKTWRVYC